MVLTRVDLPAPDGPSSTPVRAGRSSSRIASTPWPVTLLVTITGVPAETAARSAFVASIEWATSALVTRTTGTAPLCHAMVRKRSILRTLTSVAAATTKATSTFAARTWRRFSLPAARREKTVRRSTIPRISPPARVTQSPTAGSTCRAIAR